MSNVTPPLSRWAFSVDLNSRETPETIVRVCLRVRDGECGWRSFGVGSSCRAARIVLYKNTYARLRRRLDSMFELLLDVE